MDLESREAVRSTALIPLRSPSQGLRADPDLQERVSRAAAASGLPPPTLLPGVAALILPVSLPLRTDRQRRAALPFAVEPFLAEPLDQVCVVLGPQVSDRTWICVAVNHGLLGALTQDVPETCPVFPDTLAVPLPSRPDVWALWCGREVVHIRLADGTGLAVARDAFADAWRAFGAPMVEILHGTLPPGVRGVRAALTPVDPAIFGTNLNGNHPSGWFSRFRGLTRFAAGVALAAGLAHTALLHADAALLADVVTQRTEAVQSQLDARGIALAATAPPPRIEAAIVASGGDAIQQDTFLAQLAQMLSALPTESAVTVRDLRFDAASGSLAVLLAAAGLQDLQTAESALLNAGISVTSGAATRSDAGAEVQLVIGGNT